MKRNVLIKYGLLLVFLFVTFFSIKINSNAASFKYEDFDWDEFAKKNKSYWVSFCDSSDDEDCVDKVLATKKEFYVNLYKYLSKNSYTKQIDDNIIIATVFYGLDATSFKDPGAEVVGDKFSFFKAYSPYNIDQSESKDSYIGEVDNSQSALDYFKEEKDSLKTLINAFIGYTTTCYIYTGEEVKSSDNGKYCDSGNPVINDRCAEVVGENIKGSFFDQLGLSFSNDSAKNKCAAFAKEKGYNESFPSVSDTKEVNEEFYWNFLENSNYLDKKLHLRSYYTAVLSKVKKNNMSELTSTEYEENSEELKKIRRRIIRGIQEVLEYYKGVSEKYNKSCTTNYWWPIGGSEITDSNGKKMAIGDPVSVTVSSNFGKRTSPTLGASTNHKGIDIAAPVSTTPVIAVQSGTVVSGAQGENGSCVEGDSSCGGGYGNFVIIQHTDGNYTLYAHMDTGSIIVNEGDTVSQGQVIGNVGSTGTSTGGHLHFEVRVGGNDPNSVQDPITFINASEPRTTGTCGEVGELSKFIAILEGGKKASDNYYIVENIGDGVRTFGHGITVENNADIITAHGYDPTSLVIGSKVEVAVADAMYEDIIKREMEAVKSTLSQYSISGLNDNQLGALVSLKFNCGNINGFVDAYKQYGATDALCTNWWHKKALHDKYGKYYPGLAKRRVSECDLFVNGNYNMNPYG